MGITRDEILRRARSIPQNTVPYSQSAIGFAGAYRADCSGFVAMAWGVAPNGPGCWGGFSTVSAVLNGYMKEIPWGSLLPGDAIGHCGPGTGGDFGHIILVVSAPDRKGGVQTLEQSGGRRGPHTGVYTPGSGYKAYRYVGVVEGGAPSTTEGDDDLSSKASAIVEAWSQGMPKASDGTGVEPVKWRVRDEAWQAKVDADIAAIKAAITQGRKDDATRMAAVSSLLAEIAAKVGVDPKVKAS